MFVQEGILKCGCQGTFAPVFLNPQLYKWFQKLINETKNPTDNALLQFRTICRWRINEQLANSLMNDPNGPVVYTPAFGRAMFIGNQVYRSWAKDIAYLETTLSTIITEKTRRTDWNNLVSSLGSSLKSETPLLGIWLILKLNKECTIKHLVEEIAKARNDDRIRCIRDWLTYFEIGNSKDIDSVCKDIEKELVRNLSRKKNNVSLFQGKLRVVNKIPLLINTEIQIIAELNKEFSTESTKDILTGLRRKLFLNYPATVLTGIIEDILINNELYKKAMDRISCLIQS
jgi:hypothetical protein